MWVPSTPPVQNRGFRTEFLNWWLATHKWILDCGINLSGVINLGHDFIRGKKRKVGPQWVLAPLKECSLLVLCPGNPSLLFMCFGDDWREGKSGSLAGAVVFMHACLRCRRRLFFLI